MEAKFNYGQFLRFIVAHADKVPLILNQLQAIAAADGAVGRWNAFKPFGDTLAPLVDEIQAMLGVDVLDVETFSALEVEAQGIFKGDGSRLKKLFELFEKWAPVLLPIFLDQIKK